MSELRYWLWLSAAEGLRPRTRSVLLAHYGGPREIYFARRGEYKTIEGVMERECAALEQKDLDPALEILRRCEEAGIALLTLQDAAYPLRLRNIYDPPVVLYVRGRLPAMDDEAAVAVVGTRRASPYGEKMARRLGYELTVGGGLVVSGLTRGVDAAAAVGALEAGGRCVGVLPTAADEDYGGALARDVAAVGALVSEYPPGCPGSSSHFRARNRVTSGLSVAAVVVEAPEKSGALLFADEALSQGREVFVVPANADAPNARGSNGLLREGATPVSGGWDVLCEFEPLFPGKLKKPANSGSLPARLAQPAPVPESAPAAEDLPETGEGFAKLREPSGQKGIDKPEAVAYIDLKKRAEPLSAAQRAILAVMTAPSTHVDDIIRLTGLSAAAVLSELTLLQIQGLVRQEGGKRFSLI